MRSDCTGLVQYWSKELVTTYQLAEVIMEIADVKLEVEHISGPHRVGGRNSDNKVMNEKLGWESTMSLTEGLKKTQPRKGRASQKIYTD